MPVAIVATVGSASANSFVTLAETTTYMSGRLNSTLWDAATTDSQNRALVEATREISVQNYTGRRSDTVQALSWPRWAAPNPDSPVGFLFDTNIVPQRVKDATMELANQFIVAGTTDIASLDPTIGVRLSKVDVLETEYFEPGVRARGLKRFPRVWEYIAPLLEFGSNSIPLVRG